MALWKPCYAKLIYGQAFKTLRERIEPVYQRLRTVIIENLDWIECVDKYDREGVVMYIDPPYPGNGANYVHNMKTWDDHEKLLKRLTQTRCKWILSSYDIPEVHHLYNQYSIIPVSAYSGMKAQKHGSERVVNQEVLILNYATSKDIEESITQQLKLRLVDTE